MRKIMIDGRDFENIEVLHDVLKDKLDFPDYYVRILDALWDCLTGVGGFAAHFSLEKF